MTIDTENADKNHKKLCQLSFKCKSYTYNFDFEI